MHDFARCLDALVAPLDPERHEREIDLLRRCRALRDLERLLDGGGWLTPGKQDPRLKLHRHGSGTFMVLQYDDGWSTRLAMQDFPVR